MGEHSRIELPAERDERFGVLVGWTHGACGQGINLRLQSARSQAGLRAGQVDTNHLLLTRNQALLLARYLLTVTGQSDGLEGERPHRWRAALSRLRGR